MPKRLLHLAALAAAVITLGSAQANAGYTLTLSKEFSGSGTPDFDVAKMEWQDSTGGVLVTLTALVTGDEKITEFDFNLADKYFDPGQNPNPGISVVQQTGPTASIGLKQDQFKADGDGKFDVSLGFPTSGDTFGAGDVATFLITGVTENDLLEVSQDGGDPHKTGFYAAAHVQNIGAAGLSGWYASGNPSPTPPPPPAVPAPPTVILAGLGMLGFGGWTRLRRRFTLAA